MMPNMYEATVDKTDLENVHASCSCGEWEFDGDWDDMCDSWFIHEMDPSYKYLYITKLDHKGQTFLTRDASVRAREILDERKARLERQ